MARSARIPGEYLHVIVRGIGKQILFENDEDYWRFLSVLQKYKSDCEIGILAYCLMENHVHLLIHNKENKVALFMKKVGVSYAKYYNEKYERTGHLFQDRYKSETIKDERNLLTVFRYILNNPQNAGIAKSQNYAWSSIHEYGKVNCLSDSSMLEKMIGSNEQLLKFLNDSDENEFETEFMEDIPAKHDDAWAMEIICKVTNASSGTVLQKMSKSERDEMLTTIKKAGLSIRQIERLTGINRGVIQKAKIVN